MRRHLLNSASLSVGKIGPGGFEKCLSIHFRIPLKGARASQAAGSRGLRLYHRCLTDLSLNRQA